MQCAHCIREFIPRSYNQRYCNIRCKDRATSKRARDRATAEGVGIAAQTPNADFRGVGASESDRLAALAKTPAFLQQVAEAEARNAGKAPESAESPMEKVLKETGYSTEAFCSLCEKPFHPGSKCNPEDLK